MVNCVHPSHLAPVLRAAAQRDEPWLTRFRGLRANASAKTHAELDASTTLDRGDPAALGRGLADLQRDHGLTIVGGCCGTDAEHLACIASACRWHAQDVLLAGAGAPAGGRRCTRASRVRPARVRHAGVRGAGGPGAAGSRQAHRARARRATCRRPTRRRSTCCCARSGPNTRRDELVGVGMAPFFYLPHTLFVAERGLDHFDLSMRAQYELTKRFSAEAQHPAVHRARSRADVRRSCGAGPRDRERPRAPAGVRGHAAAAALGAAVAWLDANPERVLELLELLKDDPDDAGAPERGQQPERPGQGAARSADRAPARRWLEGASPERRALVEHALRSAVKRGEAGALRLLGYGKKAAVARRAASASSRRRVAIGGRVA